MEISIQINKQEIIRIVEAFFSNSIRYAYLWLSSDGEVLGFIVGVYHILLAVSMPILIFVSHTIYPSFWFKLYIIICLIFVFIQHIFLNMCILIPLEEKLTKQKTIFYPVLEQFLLPLNISVPQFISYVVVSEGTAIICFGLELVSIISRFVFKHYGIEL
jgi:hypothetical protein